jgi:nicotinamide mononucleotide transporter
MYNLFILAGQTVSPLELFAVITGVAGVWLTVRRNILCFPIGIINVLCYAYIFFQSEIRLYSDALLQLFFCIMLVYGWISWRTNRQDDEVIIEKTTTGEWIFFSALVAVITLTAGWLLYRFTEASYPFLDTGLSVISVFAQWMTAKRRIENWLLWMVVNVVYIPLYWIKGLPFTAILYAFFFVIAVNGWLSWQQSYRNQQR